MNRTDELAKIEQAIKETEIRLKSMQINLESIDSDIKKISVLERTLVDNVNTLKSQQIIAIAKEFKKVKEELRKVKNKLSSLNIDKERYGKMIEDINTFLKNARDQHNKLSKESENNILEFRRKDGKK